jgi:hypothetical protein
MNDHDPYEAWKTAHADIRPGEAFADGVMDRIARYQAQHRPSRLAEMFNRLMSHWYAAAAMVLLAVGLEVARFAVPLVLLLCTAQ